MPGMFDDVPPQISLERQILCAEREVRMRERVYPGWVANGRLKPHSADEEIEAMKAIVRTLREIAAKREPTA